MEIVVTPDISIEFYTLMRKNIKEESFVEIYEDITQKQYIKISNKL
jgi:hypothetical protein